MSLIFTDSFDDGMVAQKWTNYANFSTGYSPTFGLTGGRNGQCLDLITGDQTIMHNIAAADQHATMVLGFAVKQLKGTSGTTQVQVFLYNGSTQSMYLQGQQDGSLTVRDQNFNYQVHSPAGVLQMDVWQYVEIKVVLSSTAAGSVEVRVGGNAVATYAGRTSFSGGPAFTQLGLRGFGSGPSAPPGGTLIDDLYLCNGAGTSNNDFLGDVSIEALRPTSDVATAWTPTPGPDHYTAVNDSTFDQTTYLTATGSAQKDVFGHGALARTSGPVRGVMLNTVAAATDSGGATMQSLLRVGGTDHTSANETLTTTQALQNAGFDVNPATGAAWTIADVNALDVGVVSV